MSNFEIKILIHFHPSQAGNNEIYFPRILVRSLHGNVTIASYFLVCVAIKTVFCLRINVKIPRPVPARVYLSVDTLRGWCQNLPWFLTRYVSVMPSWIRGFKGVSNQLTQLYTPTVDHPISVIYLKVDCTKGPLLSSENAKSKMLKLAKLRVASYYYALIG